MKILKILDRIENGVRCNRDIAGKIPRVVFPVSNPNGPDPSVIAILTEIVVRVCMLGIVRYEKIHFLTILSILPLE